MFSRYTYPSVKNLFEKFTLLVVFLLIFVQFSKGQERIVQKPCFDSVLQKQADSLKDFLTQRGFIVAREATMTMQSQYEMPVIVPLTEGTWYQFVFLGDKDSKLYEVRMYDWGEKQVVYKKNGIENNLIMFPYIPKQTTYFMIKPVQVSNIKKKKELCGYLIIFKKVK